MSEKPDGRGRRGGAGERPDRRGTGRAGKRPDHRGRAGAGERPDHRSARKDESGAGESFSWNPSLGERARWIAQFWQPHRKLLVFLILLTFISSGVAIAYPLAFRAVLDRLALAAQQDDTALRRTLWSVLLLLGAIAVGRFLAGMYPAFRAWVNLRIDVDIRKKVFGAILEKDHRFFGSFRTGDLATRLLDDIMEYPKLAWFSCSGVFRPVESGSKLIFCLTAMFLLDFRLAALAVTPLPIMLYVLYRLRNDLRDALSRQQIAISETNDMLEATFSGIRIVQAFTAESNQSRTLASILEARARVQLRIKRLFAAIQIIDLAASRLGQLVVLGVGGYLVSRGELSLGTLYAMYVYLDMLVEPMVDLPNLFVTSRQAFVCMDREEEVLRFPVSVRHSETGAAMGPLRSIELRRVAASFPGANRPALQGIDLTLRRGETVAIVGEVGSGKSTLLRLLSGLVRADEGEVLVNDQPIEQIRWDDYRRSLGYAPQESLLFSESIRENIELGRDVDDARDGEHTRAADHIREGAPGHTGDDTHGGAHGPAAGDWRDGDGASRNQWLDRLLGLVHLDVEVAKMAQGAETVLGQKGTRISGGQRQRVSIARALYARPELILFDDATASLDAKNEDRLWNGLRELAPEAIVVVVSHRIATVARADRIVVLDRGRMVDSGTHHELIARCPAYQSFRDRESKRAAIDHTQTTPLSAATVAPGPDGARIP